MDWTMLANAKDTGERLRTLAYLLRLRYAVDPQVAAARLAGEAASHASCRLVLSELRAELASPSFGLGLGTLLDDVQMRAYFAQMMRAVDRQACRQ
ncbi:hypothetical protein [Luteimonas aquatica]|uniref:hypothetical protein n=1 Tax=Luteimonas aquatica TaxID=450364 RepID=UPI001F59947D|nr:hypothetical protein [Luteimonas aquatica]